MAAKNVAYVYRGDKPLAQVVIVDAQGAATTYDFRVNEPVPLPAAAGIERHRDFEKVTY